MRIRNVDHLVYAVTDLERGVESVEEQLGVRAIPGGRHPQFGTRNALLSLGPETYLEIIALDPEITRPPRGVVFGLEGLRASRLATWVLRTATIDHTAAIAASAGLDLGAIETGRREATDGTMLSWQASDPYAMPLDGAVPFLIDWGTTPHPATIAPRAGTLIGLGIEHPEPDRVRAALALLGVDGEVERGDTVRLIARIRTAEDVIELS